KPVKCCRPMSLGVVCRPSSWVHSSRILVRTGTPEAIRGAAEAVPRQMVRATRSHAMSRCSSRPAILHFGHLLLVTALLGSAGCTGDDGDTGPQGPPGDPGTNSDLAQ